MAAGSAVAPRRLTPVDGDVAGLHVSAARTGDVDLRATARRREAEVAGGVLDEPAPRHRREPRERGPEAVPNTSSAVTGHQGERQASVAPAPQDRHRSRRAGSGPQVEPCVVEDSPYVTRQRRVDLRGASQVVGRGRRRGSADGRPARRRRTPASDHHGGGEPGRDRRRRRRRAVRARSTSRWKPAAPPGRRSRDESIGRLIGSSSRTRRTVGSRAPRAARQGRDRGTAGLTVPTASQRSRRPRARAAARCPARWPHAGRGSLRTGQQGETVVQQVVVRRLRPHEPPADVAEEAAAPQRYGSRSTATVRSQASGLSAARKGARGVHRSANASIGPRPRPRPVAGHAGELSDERR